MHNFLCCACLITSQHKLVAAMYCAYPSLAWETIIIIFKSTHFIVHVTLAGLHFQGETLRTAECEETLWMNWWYQLINPGWRLHLTLSRWWTSINGLHLFHHWSHLAGSPAFVWPIRHPGTFLLFTLLLHLLFSLWHLCQKLSKKKA